MLVQGTDPPSLLKFRFSKQWQVSIMALALQFSASVRQMRWLKPLHGDSVVLLNTGTAVTMSESAADQKLDIFDDADVKFMRLAILEAQKCEPVEKAYNVGAVLVDQHRQRVLACGYSRELPGNTHAEECCFMKLGWIGSDASTQAPADSPILQSPSQPAKSARDLASVVLYTTMEPCSTRLSGKRSCCDHLLSLPNIQRVVIGAREPDNFVMCEGLRILREVGRTVILMPTLQDECLAPNKHLFAKS